MMKLFVDAHFSGLLLCWGRRHRLPGPGTTTWPEIALGNVFSLHPQGGGGPPRPRFSQPPTGRRLPRANIRLRFLEGEARVREQRLHAERHGANKVDLSRGDAKTVREHCFLFQDLGRRGLFRVVEHGLWSGCGVTRAKASSVLLGGSEGVRAEGQDGDERCCEPRVPRARVRVDFCWPAAARVRRENTRAPANDSNTCSHTHRDRQVHAPLKYTRTYGRARAQERRKQKSGTYEVQKTC